MSTFELRKYMDIINENAAPAQQNRQQSILALSQLMNKIKLTPILQKLNAALKTPVSSKQQTQTEGFKTNVATAALAGAAALGGVGMLKGNQSDNSQAQPSQKATTVQSVQQQQQASNALSPAEMSMLKGAVQEAAVIELFKLSRDPQVGNQLAMCAALAYYASHSYGSSAAGILEEKYESARDLFLIYSAFQRSSLQSGTMISPNDSQVVHQVDSLIKAYHNKISNTVGNDIDALGGLEERNDQACQTVVNMLMTPTKVLRQK